MRENLSTNVTEYTRIVQLLNVVINEICLSSHRSYHYRVVLDLHFNRGPYKLS